jgi:hypothetical protein
MISRRLVLLTTVFLFSGGILVSRAQDASATPSSSQTGSLGDAARKVRAEKKNSSKPANVFTNDDLGGLTGRISVIGDHPALASGTDITAEGTAGKKADDRKKDEAQWRAKFAAARKTLTDDTKELDILQRELNLKQQQYSQDPNWAMHQQNTREDINKTRDEIDTKKADIDRDNQALSNLEDELRKAGGDPGWAR